MNTTALSSFQKVRALLFGQNFKCDKSMINKLYLVLAHQIKFIENLHELVISKSINITYISGTFLPILDAQCYLEPQKLPKNG